MVNCCEQRNNVHLHKKSTATTNFNERKMWRVERKRLLIDTYEQSLTRILLSSVWFRKIKFYDYVNLFCFRVYKKFETGLLFNTIQSTCNIIENVYFYITIWITLNKIYNDWLLFYFHVYYTLLKGILILNIVQCTLNIIWTFNFFFQIVIYITKFLIKML